MGRPSGHRLNPAAWTDILRLTGQSRAEVAELAEIAGSTLSALCGGHHGASVPMTQRIALAARCSPATLFPTLVPELAQAMSAEPTVRGGRPAGHLLNRVAWDDVLRYTGRSLTQVAADGDVPRPTLSSLLGGHHRASVPTCHTIATTLGVHPETLFPTLAVVATAGIATAAAAAGGDR